MTENAAMLQDCADIFANLTENNPTNAWDYVCYEKYQTWDYIKFLYEHLTTLCAGCDYTDGMVFDIHEDKERLDRLDAFLTVLEAFENKYQSDMLTEADRECLRQNYRDIIKPNAEELYNIFIELATAASDGSRA